MAARLSALYELSASKTIFTSAPAWIGAANAFTTGW
jgi:hypothetical protein